MRISRDEMMLSMAEYVAMRGSCSKLQVGAVIARDHRCISTGYNGAPAAVAHCVHTLDEDARITCERSVHAEANAIAYAARYGVSTEGCTLYVTHQPCINCSKLIINSGIRRVVYRFPYRLREGIDLLREVGITVEQG